MSSKTFFSNSILVSLSLVAFAVSGCNSSSNSSGSGGTTDNGGGGGTTTLTAADLAAGGYSGGEYYEPCITISGNTYGSALSGDSLLKSVSYQSNGDYRMSVFIYTGTNCGYSSGTEIGLYYQTGTFSLTGSTNSPSGGYDIEYASSSQQLTIYAGQTGGPAFATAMNGSNCAGGFGMTFSTSGTSTSTSMGGLTCNTNNVDLSFASNGDFYDVIIPSSLSSPSSIQVYQGISPFYMGQFSSYPTAASLTFSNSITY